MLKSDSVLEYVDEVEICFGYLDATHLIEVTNIEKSLEMRTIVKIPRSADVDKLLNRNTGVLYKKIKYGSSSIRVGIAYIMDNFGFAYKDLTEEQLKNVGRAYYYEYHNTSYMFWNESYSDVVSGRLSL